ncbi:VanZ family protein [Streptomyces sp. NPDC020472]|uniref:VanZ family protein n=1 Tax=Streptomyces sp. NPDC020472 TaxID=3365075 RepID=UPI0037895A62
MPGRPGARAPEARTTAPARRGPGRFVRTLVTLTAFAGMVAFAVVLARLTLEASPASEPLTHSNLTPGRSIENYLNQPGFVETVKQVGGNIALGVPFGILLPLLSRKTRGLLRVVLVTAATMLLVELVQGALVTGRAFDIDDVLLNTTGALLGYALVGRRLGRAVRPRTRPRWWKRRPGDSSA